MPKESWSDFEKYLVQRIDGLEERVQSVDKKLVALRTKLVTLGSFFGIVTSAVYHYFQKKLQ